MPTAGDEGPWDPLWINMFRRGPWCSGEGVAAPIPPELNMYVPFSCHACKRGAICATLLPPAKLKKCSSCKIVRYCSQEHQRQDWPNHKADCKALQELRGNQAMRAVYRLSLGVFGSLEGLQRYLQHGVSILDVRAAAAGGRQPMSETAMMWTQQPHCANCYSLDGDGDQKLMACQVCGCVAWCQTCMAEMSHLMDEKGNLPHHSRAVCYTYVLSVACLGMISEQGSVLAISSNTPCEAFTAVESWTDYLDLKRSDFEVPEYMLKMANACALLTDGLSLSMTIYLSLRRAFGDTAVSQMTDITVHVIGAGTSEMYGSEQKFYEISNLIPTLQKIEIVMVGPYLKTFQRDLTANVCDPWKDSTCRITLTTSTELYHDYVSKDPTWTPPTIAVAQNSGIHDPRFKELWRETALLLIEKEVLFVVTGFTAAEAEADAATLVGWGAKVEQPPQENPFRSLRPFFDSIAALPSGETVPDFYYTNAHFSMIRGRAASTQRT